MSELMLIGLLAGLMRVMVIVVVVLLGFAAYGIANTRVRGEISLQSKGKRFVFKSKPKNRNIYPDDKPQAFYSNRR